MKDGRDDGILWRVFPLPTVGEPTVASVRRMIYGGFSSERGVLVHVCPCKGPLFQQVKVLPRQRWSRPGSYPSDRGGNEAVEAWEKEGTEVIPAKGAGGLIGAHRRSP